MSLSHTLRKLRHKVSLPQASFQMCVLGVLAGLSSAGLIIIFRLIINNTQLLFSPEIDNFVHISTWHKILLPIAGALIIAAMINVSPFKNTRLGIPFVIHRYKTAYGNMPLLNAINQFFGGAIALICGFSVGREGPSVHIGASGSSYIGNWLKLPYNSIKILTGCGIAAGISASFNTPLAAVIFVMEVVVRDYKIHVFIPIMLSSVMGAFLTQMVFGNDHDLALIQVTTLANTHYPFLIVCGFIIGTIAWWFNRHMMQTIQISSGYSIFPRLLMASFITAFIGYFIPQALGSGMGAIQFSISDPNNIQFLVMILIGKYLATVIALGLGIPGGIIGPILGLGVLIGTILGNIGLWFQPVQAVHGTYAVICMAGLMAATLHAPLAALVTVLELTHQPEIIVPTMLLVAMSYTTVRQIYNDRSIFVQQLIFQKLPYRSSPAVDLLQQIGVSASLDKNFTLIGSASPFEVKHYMSTLEPHEHLVIKDQYEIGGDFRLAYYDTTSLSSGADDVEIAYLPLQGLNSRSTMADAFELLHDKRDGAVYIYEDNVENIIGLIRWEQVRRLIVKRNNLI